MRKIFPADLLARDDRFVRITTEQRFMDPRSAGEQSKGRGPSEVDARPAPTRPTRRVS